LLSKAPSGNVVMVGGLGHAPATRERLVGQVWHATPAGDLGWPRPFAGSVVLRLFMGAR